MKKMRQHTGLLVMLAMVAALLAPPAAAQEGAGLYITGAQSTSTAVELELEYYRILASRPGYERDSVRTLETSCNAVSAEAMLRVVSGRDGTQIHLECLTDLDGNGAYEYNRKRSPVTVAGLGKEGDQPLEVDAGESWSIAGYELFRWGLEVERRRVLSDNDAFHGLSAVRSGNMIFCIYVQEADAAEAVSYYVQITREDLSDEVRKQLGAACFTDVPSWIWYWPSVDYCVNRGLLTGTGRSTFSPDGLLSRATLVQVLYNRAGAPLSVPADFPDVKEGDWYYKSVSWALENLLVGGYDDGRFHPDDLLTREQMALIIYRSMGEKAVFTAARADLSVYPDGDQVSSWAKSAMSWAIGEGLFSARSNGMLDSGGSVTRAELSAVLMNLDGLKQP